MRQVIFQGLYSFPSPQFNLGRPLATYQSDNNVLILSEQLLYGSDRLGLYRPNRLVAGREAAVQYGNVIFARGDMVVNQYEGKSYQYAPAGSVTMSGEFEAKVSGSEEFTVQPGEEGSLAGYFTRETGAKNSTLDKMIKKCVFVAMLTVVFLLPTWMLHGQNKGGYTLEIIFLDELADTLEIRYQQKVIEKSYFLTDQSTGACANTCSVRIHERNNLITVHKNGSNVLKINFKLNRNHRYLYVRQHEGAWGYEFTDKAKELE